MCDGNDLWCLDSLIFQSFFSRPGTTERIYPICSRPCWWMSVWCVFDIHTTECTLVLVCMFLTCLHSLQADMTRTTPSNIPFPPSFFVPHLLPWLLIGLGCMILGVSFTLAFAPYAKIHSSLSVSCVLNPQQSIRAALFLSPSSFEDYFYVWPWGKADLSEIKI